MREPVAAYVAAAERAAVPTIKSAADAGQAYCVRFVDGDEAPRKRLVLSLSKELRVESSGQRPT
jgi:hypothetical protein